jgi:glycosyltransferase involved in cell wall biosynthesis
LQHEVNRGKGAAVRTGIEAATGSHVLIFDADDEYDPHDIAGLVIPLINGRAEVVYGTRLRGHGTIHPTLVHSLGNKLMTGTANVLYGSAISDLHTCLKLLPIPLLKEMNLTEEGFGLDTEITAEMLRRGWRPYELPISYVGRSKEEGKKIGAFDAVDCFRILFKVRRRGRVRPGLRDRRLSPPVLLKNPS